jgi:hypothetical protein
MPAFSALWPMLTVMPPAGAQALILAPSGASLSLHLVAQIFHHLGDAGHADAADADEMDWTRIKRNSAADHELP